MRRPVLLMLPVVAMLAGASIAGLIAAEPAKDPATSATAPMTTSPATPQNRLLPKLDLPALTPDPAWWSGSTPPDAIGVVWVSREGSDPAALLENDVQRELFERYVSCFPENATPEQLFLAKMECFDEAVITDAATTPNPADVFVAITALNTLRPDVFTVCHNASHRVGELALRRIVPVHGMDKDIIAALLDRGGGVCMGGLMHGVLDAVGVLVDDVSQFRPAVEACLLADQTNLGYCTDAVGHATWDAFTEIAPAAEVCAMFPTAQSRRECGEGVMMRMYQRLETEDVWYLGNTPKGDIDRWNNEIVAICKQWTATPFADAPQDDPREWCWSGSVYLFFKPVFSALEAEAGDIAKSYDEVSFRVSKVISACQKFPTPGDDRCLERMGPSIGHAAAFDESAAQRLCALFPPGTQQRCTTAALSRIESAYNS